MRWFRKLKGLTRHWVGKVIFLLFLVGIAVGAIWIAQNGSKVWSMITNEMKY